MRNTAFVLVGIVFLVIQSNLYRVLAIFHQGVAAFCQVITGWGAGGVVPWLKRFSYLFGTPNLVLPLIIFTGVHEYSVARGAALACVLGYALDLFAAAPVGLFTFVSVCVFLLSRAAGVRLGAQTRPTQLALAFLFAMAHGVLVLVLLAIFKKNAAYGTRELAGALLPSAISTALVAPSVFRIADRIHQSTLSVAARNAEGPPR